MHLLIFTEEILNGKLHSRAVFAAINIYHYGVTDIAELLVLFIILMSVFLFSSTLIKIVSYQEKTPGGLS